MHGTSPCGLCLRVTDRVSRFPQKMHRRFRFLRSLCNPVWTSHSPRIRTVRRQVVFLRQGSAAARGERGRSPCSADGEVHGVRHRGIHCPERFGTSSRGDTRGGCPANQNEGAQGSVRVAESSIGDFPFRFVVGCGAIGFSHDGHAFMVYRRNCACFPGGHSCLDLAAWQGSWAQGG